MPLDRYYHGNGPKVMAKMKAQYGDKKGEQVFYATAHKKARKAPKKNYGPAPYRPGSGPLSRGPEGPPLSRGKGTRRKYL